MNQLQPLYEKHRPQSFDEVAGQPKAVAQLRLIQERGGFAGKAFWFTGASGTGKTTLARIVARSVADDWMTEEFDSGADLTGGELDRVLERLSYAATGKGGRAVIVNESHSLRADIIDRLKGVLERIPRHVVWCFTTTREDQAQLFGDHVGAGQLLSRCVQVATTNQGLAKAFAERYKPIAMAEGLDGLPIERWVKAAQSVGNNGRALWQLVESGAMIVP